MPLQLPSRNVSDTENMLALLLCVDALDSVTAAQLWTFAAEQELMDYVTMRLCLHQLLAAGELETGEGALREQLLLTDRGREALALFGQRLPNAVRERVCKAAPAFRERVTRTRQVRAAYDMARRNEYRLTLTVTEGDLPTLCLRVQTKSRSLAGKMIHRFETNAAQTLTHLYALAESATREAQEQATPLPADAVTEHSATEFTARIVLTPPKVRLDVALLLPTRAAGEAFVRALSQPKAADEAAQRLLALLTATRPLA